LVPIVIETPRDDLRPVPLPVVWDDRKAPVEVIPFWLFRVKTIESLEWWTTVLVAVFAVLTAITKLVPLKEWARNRQLNRTVPADLSAIASTALSKYRSRPDHARMVEIHCFAGRGVDYPEQNATTDFAEMLAKLFRDAGLAASANRDNDPFSLWRVAGKERIPKSDMLLVYSHTLQREFGADVYELLKRLGYTVQEGDFDPRDNMPMSENSSGTRLQLYVGPPKIY